MCVWFVWYLIFILILFFGFQSFRQCTTLDVAIQLSTWKVIGVMIDNGCLSQTSKQRINKYKYEIENNNNNPWFLSLSPDFGIGQENAKIEYESNMSPDIYYHEYREQRKLIQQQLLKLLSSIAH